MGRPWPLIQGVLGVPGGDCRVWSCGPHVGRARAGAGRSLMSPACFTKNLGGPSVAGSVQQCAERRKEPSAVPGSALCGCALAGTSSGSGRCCGHCCGRCSGRAAVSPRAPPCGPGLAPQVSLLCPGLVSWQPLEVPRAAGSPCGPPAAAAARGAAPAWAPQPWPHPGPSRPQLQRVSFSY